MSASLTPEYLYQDELVFEVRARGADPAKNTAALRTQLRGLLASKFLTTWPPALVVSEELEKCRVKLEEWDGRLDEFKEEPPSGRSRSRALTRLKHLQGRVSLLRTVSTLKSDETEWLQNTSELVTELIGILESAATSRPAADPATAQTSIELEREVKSNASPSPERKTEPAPELKLESGSEPKIPSALVLQESTSVPVPSQPVSVCTGPIASASYHKLPNPLTPLLQALPTVDGLEINALLDFLRALFRMREIPGVDDKSLLGLLIPYCRAPLSNVLNSVLSQKGSFEDFHRETLDTFARGGRMREDLKMRMFFRSQGIYEDLAAYVTDRRSASRVLRVGLSEAEVVQSILDGITPEERSRLVFFPKPTTFAGLDKLVVEAKNMQLIDQHREGRVLAPNYPPPRPLVGQVEAPPVHPQRRSPPVCHRCGQRGHIRRFCRQGSAPPKNGEGGGLPR